MSKYFIVVIVNMGVVGGMLIAYNLFDFVKKRQRTLDSTLEGTKRGPKVLIVGGGAGGCAVASSLLHLHSDAQVTVFEPQRETCITTHMPLAAVGHRSYDLTTSGQHDTLYSPTTWNVVRDAKLVLRGVKEVQPAQSTLTDTDGVVHPYDYLVIACGAQKDLDAVPGLTAADYDRFRVVTSPGPSRDILANTYKGTILHVKVPPRLSSPSNAKHSKNKRNQEETTTSTLGKFLKSALAESRFPLSTSLTSLTAQVRSQNDCAFVSTANVLWKYLTHFNKLKLCPLIVATSEATPCDHLPSEYAEKILELWKERQLDYRTHTILERVDTRTDTAVLKNTQTGATTAVTYKMLSLDLPLVGPSWAKAAGLDDQDSDGFIAVNPMTLQHAKYHNIFALGDCAAIPTIKSYGAVFTQAHVLVHNLMTVMEHAAGRRKQDGLMDVSRSPSHATYDGYSSFPVVMSTWRWMWPEVSWPSLPSASTADHALRPPATTRATPQQKEGLLENPLPSSSPPPASPFLLRRNQHVWDNSAWRDVRGFCNGVYVQLFAYETMHWFVFLRANWNPPSWFRVPLFSSDVRPVS